MIFPADRPAPDDESARAAAKSRQNLPILGIRYGMRLPAKCSAAT